MRKLIISLLLGAFVWAMGPSLQGVSEARAQNSYIAYWGQNLFLGIAYHRFGCALNGAASVSTGNTYQGFSNSGYCHAGYTFSQQNGTASKYYGYSASGNLSDSWLGYYYCYANWDYGEALNGISGTAAQNSNNYCHSWQTGYANNTTYDVSTRSVSGAPNGCSYNVLTNCNSDCWIGDFSTKQGAIVPTLSPCF
jgi:hypothetical protein